MCMKILVTTVTGHFWCLYHFNFFLYVYCYSNADEETAKKIKALKQSEETLKQQVLELKERLANNNNGGVEIRENSTELLTKISKLEAMNRDLRDKLESEQEVHSDGGLESPEDVFRQRISELERLEKHLKHQVSVSPKGSNGGWGKGVLLVGSFILTTCTVLPL